MRAALALRSQQVGRVSTLHTISGEGNNLGLADLEQGVGVDASSSSTNQDDQATGAATRRLWERLFWRRS